MKPEAILATNVSQYMALQYPNVIYQFSIGADIRLSPWQAARMHKINGKWRKGFVDIVIYEMRKGYGGLLVELKVTTPYKKNGELKKDEHLETQNAMHEKLRRKGYKVQFCTGFDETRDVIDEYFN